MFEQWSREPGWFYYPSYFRDSWAVRIPDNEPWQGPNGMTSFTGPWPVNSYVIRNPKRNLQQNANWYPGCKGSRSKIQVIVHLPCAVYCVGLEVTVTVGKFGGVACSLVGDKHGWLSCWLLNMSLCRVRFSLFSRRFCMKSWHEGTHKRNLRICVVGFPIIMKYLNLIPTKSIPLQKNTLKATTFLK